MDISPIRHIVPLLREGKHAKFLLEHPRRRQVQLVAGSFKILRPGATSPDTESGLTRPLRSLFWENARPPSNVKRPKRREAQPGDTIQDVATGKERGDIIHRQIHDYVTMDKASFEARWPDGLHPWARLILKQLLNLGIYILATEYAVCDEEMGVATAADFIAADKNGHIYVFELKTSVSWEFFSKPQPRTPMTGCLAGVPNSALNRAMVQLGVTSLILARSLNFNDFTACVLFIGELDAEKRQVHIIEAKRDFIAGKCTDAYVELYDYMTKEDDEEGGTAMDIDDEDQDVGVYF